MEKSVFLTNLKAELKEDRDDVWIITQPLKYWSQLLNCLVTISETFETDFASVPRVPLIYSLWGNRAHREATLHDYLFRKDSIPIISCSLANEVFLEAMISTGKSWYIKYPMYSGVVLGGQSAYHKRSVNDKL